MTSGRIGTTSTHPLCALVDDLGHALDAAAGAPAWTMSPSDLTALLPRLAAVKNQLDAVELAMLREADRLQLADSVGAANTAAWWAGATRATKPAAHRAVALAEALDDDTHAVTREAMSRGDVSVDQARVILHAVDRLPGDLVGPRLRRDVEEHLVGLAEHHDPHDLRLLGQRALTVLAPEVADEADRRALEAEEKDAATTALFQMQADGEGSMRGRFKIPVLHGEILAKHLAALAAPKHRAASGAQSGGRVARPLRLGTAFMEYLETREAVGMPSAGGVPATIVVTMTMDTLLGSDKSATLDTGEQISAGQARRLACEAGIIPAVLGSPSQVLDLGRKTRFHTEPQRIAMMLRDGGCVAEGCDWPPGMCHAHHAHPWSRGGRTSVKDGRLLCPRHHTLAHDGRYLQSWSASGKVRFVLRT